MLGAGAAFVLEIDTSPDPAPQRLRGRIEHVLSGASRDFDDGAELLRFIEQVLGKGGTTA